MWREEIEAKLREVQDDPSSLSRGEHVERWYEHRGANGRHPPIESWICKEYLIVPDIESSRDIEKGVATPHDGGA
jgi:hypothetical protein